MPKLLSFSAIQAVTFRIGELNTFYFLKRKVCVSESKKKKKVTRMMRALEAVLSKD